MARMVPAPVADRPASYYLKPKTIGTKIKTTGAKEQLEEEVVKQCTEYLKKNGWQTYKIDTVGKVMQNGFRRDNPLKGIPDSLNFHPGTKRTVWIEYKRSHGGVISPDQKAWHNILKHCGNEIWVVNSLKCLKEYLDETVAIAS